ncbi:MAG: hypothetical protein ACJ782_06445, partial [Actinomycetota bacterium]
LRLLHRNLLQRSWRTVIGIPGQFPQPPVVGLPRLVQAIEVDVGEQGRCDSSHAMGNFEFEVWLAYRRGERLRRTV